METILIPIKRLFAGYYTNAVLFSADGRVIRGSLRIFAHDCVKFWSLLIDKKTEDVCSCEFCSLVKAYSKREVKS